MKIEQHVEAALIDWDPGRFDSALIHACIAIDATSKRLFPNERSVGVRYKKCIRQFYWIAEPALGMGVDLEKTKFANVKLKGPGEPDLADVVYEMFRCTHAHGQEVPPEFLTVVQEREGVVYWSHARGRLHLPNTLIIALLFIIVMAPVNNDLVLPGHGFLTLGTGENQDLFLINDWWGRSAAFHRFATKHRALRVAVVFTGDARFESGPVVEYHPVPSTKWPACTDLKQGAVRIRIKLEDLRND